MKQEDKKIPFTLNGIPVIAEPGETVLQAAGRHGVRIPTLCHHDAVSPYGGCRLCVVEAFWGKKSKLVTSCIYIPWENDVIETDTERVRRTRAMIIEMLWSRHPEVEILAELGAEYGVAKPRFAPEENMGLDRCILCGLCVRVCAEVVGANAIGYAGRGMERVITTPFADQADECIGCGACVFICPTGALHYEDINGSRRMIELHTEVPMIPCRVCGVPFASESQIARVRERLHLPDELASACPQCRAVEHRRKMEETLVLRPRT